MTTPSDLLTDYLATLLSALPLDTPDQTIEELKRGLGVVIAAHVSESQSAAEGGGAQLLDRCLEALIWCSGSNDFQRGGMARVGWERLCIPLIDELAVALRGAGGK